MKALKISLTLMAIVGTAQLSASTRSVTRSASSASLSGGSAKAPVPAAVAQPKNNKWFFGLW